MAGAVQEQSPLIKSAPPKREPKREPKRRALEPPVDVRAEFVQLTSMALQVSLSTFARIALTSIDSAFLGHLGTKELAASSLASIWTGVPLSGVWSGASALITLCGQAWGAKNGELTGLWLQMGLVITTILAIPVFIWFWCVGFVLESSTEDLEVVRLGIRFSRILSFSIFPALIYACVRLYFQSMGIMAPTTVVGTLSIGVAIAANYFLIYGAFGWGGLGFDGSPLSTVIASWFQPIALISYCILYKKMHLQAWGGWNLKAFTSDRVKTYIDIAGPIAANSLLSNLANSGISLIAAKLGSDIIAANAVISGLWGLLWALFWGFGCATQVRVANHLGANRPNAAKKLAVLGMACTILCVVTLAIVTIVMRHRVFYIYTSDDDLLNLCLLVQPIFITGFMIESTEMLMSSVLTAMGEVKITAWTSSVTIWCVELPIAYIGGVTLGFGFPMLWYAIVVGEILKFTVYLFTLSRVDWSFMAQRAVDTMGKNDVEEEEPIEEALQVTLSEAGNTPVGYASVLRSPVTPLLTPTNRPDRRRGSVSYSTPRKSRASSYNAV